MILTALPQSLNFLKASTAFTPPNPNVFDSAASMFISFARCAT